MEFKIKKIGILDEANITIDKITVVAGKNATGKSTISKILYSLLHSKSQGTEKIIKKDREELLEKYKKEFINEIFLCLNTIKNIEENHQSFIDVVPEIFKLLSKFQGENQNISEVLDVMKLLKEQLGKLEIKEPFKNKGIIEEIMKKTEKLSIREEENEIFKKVLDFTLRQEFSGEINTIGSQGEIKYCNEKEDSEIVIKIHENTVEIVENQNFFNNFKTTEVFYIESPYILDCEKYYKGLKSKFNHNSLLLEKLRSESQEKNIFEDEEETELYKIKEKIKCILNGELSYRSEKDDFTYKFENKELGVSNIASGIKVIGILQMLIEKIELDRHTYIIMDEPEVHLHPEWQIKLGEILVLLAKKIGIYIYINSHSPYFVEAIEKYSELYKLSSISYYLTEEKSNGKVKIKKIGKKNIDKIYENFAKPFEFLENIEKKER